MTDVTLHPRAPMLSKRYDFAVCQHRGFLYLIAGKDGNTEVTDIVERYDLARDVWTTLAPVNRKRYASCAAVQAESDRIFLFGGRSDLNNNMVEEVEEYDISTDTWRVVKLKSEFDPVEVCAAVQVGPGQVLVFGGSYSTIEDSPESYIFHCCEHKFEKTKSLRKGHVFVSLPFVHGNFIYAVGNEYYMKNRNIHRFNIDKKLWELIF